MEKPSVKKNKSITKTPVETKDNEQLQETTNEDGEIKIAKRRGRKPKGGKIVVPLQSVETSSTIEKPNILIHLKCSLQDLQNTDKDELGSFQFKTQSSNEYLPLENTKQNDKQFHDNYFVLQPNQEMVDTNNVAQYTPYTFIDTNTNNNTYLIKPSNTPCQQSCTCKCETNSQMTKKILWKKLNDLSLNLHKNNIDKKSACFWCTYDFDTPVIYIPKYSILDQYYVYGCFCAPECAYAYLMNENIDTATKFERYQLLNYLYKSLYMYQTNIKPAPNPYYMLDKFYGNLTIQEYRSLFQTDRLFLIVDKPLTKMMPEMVEDNDEFILNKKLIPTGNYLIKRGSTKKNDNKKDILNENFGY
jgi:hypothetical protein